MDLNEAPVRDLNPEEDVPHAEAAPASTEGRGQTHEGRQKGRGLRYFVYARNRLYSGLLLIMHANER